jgi:predicted nuclease of predicted toxin-antitoxin system
VKLLLDENLSRRIVPSLQQRFPGSTQVALVGLERAADVTLWDYAHAHGFILVSKDDDFRDLQLLRGHPPKLIVLRLGNATNAAVLEALLNAAERVIATLQLDDVGIVEIF